MAFLNSADKTALTKEDFDKLHNCVVLAIEIGAKVGLDLSFKRNVRDSEFLDELQSSLTKIKEKL